MRKITIHALFSALLVVALAACSTEEQADNTSGNSPLSGSGAIIPAADDTASELTVRFGDSSDSFTLYLEDNDTAEAIARHVGSADWRLPIYHFDDYEGWEVMQYYDIPSRCEIPSHAETVVSEQAGQVYYSEPNRIVLFYQDAEIAGEYTLVGHFEATEAFVSAVEENPVLEGWATKSSISAHKYGLIVTI